MEVFLFMAKRFIDTDIFKKSFIRGLKAPYKLLWFYLINDCNHAGIWEVDFEVAELRCGVKISETEAKKYFGEKIICFDNGKKWFLPSFIEFQYGELKEENRAHNSVIQILTKNLLIDENKGLIRGLQAPMDMDKDKDMDKDMEMDKEKGEDFNFLINIEFEVFWNLYDKKRGEVEKLKTKWNKLTDTERQLIIKNIPLYKSAQPDKQFRKDPETYLNQKSWNDEIIKPSLKKPENPHAAVFNEVGRWDEDKKNSPLTYKT